MVNFPIHLIILYINSNYEVEIKINEKTLTCAMDTWRTAKNVCRAPRSQTHDKVKLGQSAHLTGPAHHTKLRRVYKLAASSPTTLAARPRHLPRCRRLPPLPPRRQQLPPLPPPCRRLPPPALRHHISSSVEAGRRLPPLPPRRRWLSP
jgi:hypothetical protein